MFHRVAYMKEYREAHKEKLSLLKKNWKATHKEQVIKSVSAKRH